MIDRRRLAVAEPNEKWEYAGLGDVLIEVVSAHARDEDEVVWRGSIRWFSSPGMPREVVIVDPDHDTVQVACEKRILHGQGDNR